MKAMKILIGVALAASVGLNVLLWQQRERERAELKAVQAAATEAEALRAENEALTHARAGHARVAGRIDPPSALG